MFYMLLGVLSWIPELVREMRYVYTAWDVAAYASARGARITLRYGADSYSYIDGRWYLGGVKKIATKHVPPLADVTQVKIDQGYYCQRFMIELLKAHRLRQLERRQPC